MEAPELLEDERFISNAKRVENNMHLKPIIEEWLKDKKVDETVERLLAKGIPAAPINTIDKVVNDSHILSREMLVAYDTETNHVKDQKSATGVEAMRQACKNIMYTVVNSRAYDAENLETGLMTWQIAAIAADVVLGVGILALEIVAIKRFRKRLAEEKAAVAVEN